MLQSLRDFYPNADGFIMQDRKRQVAMGPYSFILKIFKRNILLSHKYTFKICKNACLRYCLPSISVQYV